MDGGRIVNWCQRRPDAPQSYTEKRRILRWYSFTIII